jgi:hypothetical protein
MDEAGLLACSMYVNLNLVRAGMANTPEESEDTRKKGCVLDFALP